MELRKVIKFLNPNDYVVMHMIDKDGEWVNEVFKGFVIDIPWSFINLPLYNDEKEDIYGISAREYEEGMTPSHGFVINIEEV